MVEKADEKMNRFVDLKKLSEIKGIVLIRISPTSSCISYVDVKQTFLEYHLSKILKIHNIRKNNGKITRLDKFIIWFLFVLLTCIMANSLFEATYMK